MDVKDIDMNIAIRSGLRKRNATKKSSFFARNFSIFRLILNKNWICLFDVASNFTFVLCSGKYD